ncbi:hypothetical protein PIB30_034237, partial [Stylosanthes scabra]|nr:hypothetical protein [Stylosanthes scabra]
IGYDLVKEIYKDAKTSDLDQWGTDVAGAEPTAAQDWDSAEEEEDDRSTSSTSTN